ncbi:DUF397 domain-containing protein [Streptomyces sp. NPDC007264]|uniref:DUF397 domain-containing protein n=1 Tax=Streptomyces sp. NPDC007264 TaxID=3364777 RepID=UPI0036DA8AAF
MSTPELHWYKSSHSGDDSGDCIEIAPSPSTVHVRDSKNPTGPRLALSPAAWADFCRHVGR